MMDRHGSSSIGNECRTSLLVSRRSLHGLDWLNFFLADVQTGVGPFLAIYLSANGWNEQSVGLALTVGGIAGIIMQTPAGALVDQTRSKRALIAVGVVALIIGSLGIALFPSTSMVMSAQVIIGMASCIFGPAIAAVSLGIVGQRAFDHRQARNQAFNSAGNVVAALLAGTVGYLISNRSVFFFVVALSVPTLFSLARIRPDDINYEMARNLKDGRDDGRPVKLQRLLRDRPLLVFLVSAVMFHFANAAMLPLLGEMLAKGKGRSSMMFMAACVVTTQLIITLLSPWAGDKASRWGRKPLLLIAFAVLPIRGLLYTVTRNTSLLVAIQVLDGIGAGIFGVVSVLVIADLTRGTGRFNLAQGAIATAVGVGASLSQGIAGGIVHHFTYHAGFFFLAAVAFAALLLFWLCMPETRRNGDAENTINSDQLSRAPAM